MLKFELLNIFLFQHPKDGLGEELNTNQICVIRGDQFFDKPEDGNEEYFVSEPNEFDYWDYWNAEQAGFSRNVFYGGNHLFGKSRFAEYKDLKLLSLSLNSRLSLFKQQQNEAIGRIERRIDGFEQQQNEAIGRIERRIDGFEQRLLVCLLLIFHTQQENGRQFDFIKRGMRLMIGQMRRMNGRFDALEREMGQMQQTLTLTSLQSDVSLFMVRTNEDELRNIEARLATIEARLGPPNVDNNVAAGAGGLVVANVNNVGVGPLGPQNVDNVAGGPAVDQVNNVAGGVAHVNNVAGGAGGVGQNNVGEE